MENINEAILEAWIDLITAVDSERLVFKMPYNEAIICNILYRNQDKEVTATDLCKYTKMQKSQMNRTLTSLENKGFIKRNRSLKDRREITIELINDNSGIFKEVHNSNLALIDKIISRIGVEHAEEIIKLFSTIATIAKEEIK